MMTRSNPTSVGRFSSSGRMCLRLVFPDSSFACAAAFTTDKVLTKGDVVGEGDFKMMLAVECATPGYFCAWRSMAYLFRRNMLACVWKCFSVSFSFGTSSKSRWVM